MALAAATPRVTYAGNGSVSSFPVSDGDGNPIYFESNSTIHVATYIPSSDTWTDLAEGVDYSLFGGPLNGSVTLLGGPLATGTNLVVWRRTPLDQPVEFGANSEFAAKSHTDLADRHRRVDQELADDVSRSLKLYRSGDAYDVGGLKLRNIGNAVLPGDAVPLSQMGALTAQAQAAADAAEIDAATAQAAASSAQGFANSASDDADIAQAAAASASADAAVLGTELGNIQAIIGGETTTLSPFTQLLDDISGGFNGIAVTFDLAIAAVPKNPASASQILVHLGGVYQTPGLAYTVSNNTITFDAAPAAGLPCAILFLQTEIAS